MLYEVSMMASGLQNFWRKTSVEFDEIPREGLDVRSMQLSAADQVVQGTISWQPSHFDDIVDLCPVAIKFQTVALVNCDWQYREVNLVSQSAIEADFFLASEPTRLR